MIKVIPFIYQDYDDLCANTYLLIDEDKNCVVIDPSSLGDGVTNYIKREELTLKGIILTHGHIDHFRGVSKLLDAFKVNVYISFEDEPNLMDSTLNCSKLLGKEETLNIKAITVSDNEILHLLNDELKIIMTPYHSSGSMCIYSEVNNILFSGDSLFKKCIGRYDLPGSKPKLIHSSLEKLYKLPSETKVYPGHGQFTSIKDEAKLNTFC